MLPLGPCRSHVTHRLDPARGYKGVSTEQLQASRKRSHPADDLGGLQGWAADTLGEAAAYALVEVWAALGEEGAA